jgi:hypothetical protein
MDLIDHILDMEEEEMMFRLLMNVPTSSATPRVTPTGERKIIHRDRLFGNERLVNGSLVGEVTGIYGPSVRSASSIARPMGQKRRRIDSNNNEELLLHAGELADISRDHLTLLQERNDILKEKNEISRKRLKMEEKQLLLAEKKLKVEEEYSESKIQLNDIKILREPEENIDDADARKILAMMKERIKNKWLPSA